MEGAPGAPLDVSKMSLYYAFGQLLGMAMRTGVRLPLALPSQVWKTLLLEPLTREDITQVDDELLSVSDCFHRLETLGVTEENFGSLFSQQQACFCSVLSYTSII